MTLTRRRMMAITAAALAAGSVHAGQIAHHRFRALGADCVLTLPGDVASAAEAGRAVEAEIRRIERAFSLWDPYSELSRLNQTGRLTKPSSLFHALAQSAMLASARTGGSFDVTVQARWLALEARQQAASSPVGWSDLEITKDEIRFRRPGMSATFNGIAQGYAADRAVLTLRRFGYRDLLVDLGEFSGLGQHPDGRVWLVGVQHPLTDAIAAEIPVPAHGVAIATSAPRGTLIGGQPHIFDPLLRSGPRWAGVTVVAPHGWLADAVSTAVAAAPMANADAMLRANPVEQAVLIAEDGSVTRWAP